jgi:type I restriction enzyme, S subunit
MNNIPTGWIMAPLAELTEPDAPIIYGILQPGPETPNGVPYIRPTEIVDDAIDIGSVRRTTPVIAERYRRSALRENDILLSIVGTIGKVAIVPAALNGANITQSSCRVRPDSKLVERDFIAHVLRSPMVRTQFSDMRLGTAVPRLNLEDVRKIVTPIAPKPEQRRIVATINSLSAKSRRTREHLDHIPRLVEKYKQAILIAAFRGDLTLDSDRSEFKARPFSEVVASTFYGPRIAKDAYVPNGIPTLRTTDIGDWGLIAPQEPPQVRVSAAEFEKWGLKHGDLMITRTGATIGKCAVYDASLGPALPSAYLIRVRLELGLIDPTFAVLFLLSPLGQQQLLDGRTAVAQPNINAPAIVSIKLPVPKPELQTQIVRRIQSAFTWIDRLASEAGSARKLIDHLDQAILAKAFRGELVPQDPNDEPASVLLERIRAERTVQSAATGSTVRKKQNSNRKHV